MRQVGRGHGVRMTVLTRMLLQPMLNRGQATITPFTDNARAP